MAAKLPSMEWRRARLNWFTKNYLKGVQPIPEKGETADAEYHRRVQVLRYYVGEGSKINDCRRQWTVELTHRSQHFNDRRYPEFERKRGTKRRRIQRAQWLKNHLYSYISPGVVRYHGVPVAKVAIPYLEYARSHDWQGRLNSGYRTPVYSESLCYAMCGAPQCAGRCAGRSSNHSHKEADNFAVDVSDSSTFGRLMAQMPNPPNGIRIFNALGSRDVVHFSPSGR